MARRTLQVVRHRPVILVAVGFADHVGDERRDAAQLRVAEGVFRTGVGEEASVCIGRAFGHHDHAVADALHGLLDARQERHRVEGDLREQDDVRRCIAALAGEPACGGDPTGMAPHHLHHEHFGGSPRHRGDIERGLECGHGDELGDRAEARAAVGEGQIVVHGLRHADAGDGVAERLAHLRDLVRGVHRVVAAVVEEISDVMGLEDLDQTLVLGAVLVQTLELEAC